MKKFLLLRALASAPERRVIVAAAVAMIALLAASAALADKGGNKTGQACQKGAYAFYYDPSTGQPFASQDACVSFVATGGTLVGDVDYSVAFQTGSSSFFSSCPECGDVVVTNPAPFPVSVHVEVDFGWSTPQLFAGFENASLQPPDCPFPVNPFAVDGSLLCQQLTVPADTELSVAGFWQFPPRITSPLFGHAVVGPFPGPLYDPNPANDSINFTMPAS